MSKLDDDEQEVKKSKGKKKIHYLKDHNSDDKETNSQGPGNKGTDDNDNDDNGEMRPMMSKR